MNVQEIVVVAEVKSLELAEIERALGALLDRLDELINGTVKNTLDVGGLALGTAVATEDVDHSLKQIVDVRLHSLGMSLHARLDVEVIWNQKQVSYRRWERACRQHESDHQCQTQLPEQQS